MFEKIQKASRSKSIVAYIIFGAISLVFVFFGMGYGNLGGIGGGSGAAVVNSAVISVADYQKAYENLSEQAEKRLAHLPDDVRQQRYEDLKRQAIESLVEFELVAQEAQSMGLRVADEEVRDYLLNIPAFQDKDGVFQFDRYQNYLRYMNMSAGQLEDRLRKEMVQQKIRNLFTWSLGSIHSQKDLDFLSQTKTELAFVKFQKKDLGAPSEKQLKAFMEKKKSEMEDYYKKHKVKYFQPEEVHARHILIKVKNGDEKKALAKIKEIEAQLKKGASFKELAAKYSEGPTRKKGGDLGYFQKGKMVPEFEKVAFSLPVGKVSGPVKTSFGYHLIKVEDKKKAHTKPFEEVRTEVAKELFEKEHFETLKKKLKEALKNLEKKESAAQAKAFLNQFIKEKKLKWESTSEFSLDQFYYPKLSLIGDKVLEEVIHKKIFKKDSWVPQLFQQGIFHYLVKVKKWIWPQNLKKEKANEEPLLLGDLSNTLNFRAYYIFSEWRKLLRQKARVRYNSQLLGQLNRQRGRPSRN
ncbi:MAG: hypothetical protein D6797_08400 [Bdellovibrio sp.]|nr:MAG: hypothetical protein D6797_08400 [Bdellovibrio sp.]